MRDALQGYQGPCRIPSSEFSPRAAAEQTYVCTAIVLGDVTLLTSLCPDSFRLR